MTSISSPKATDDPFGLLLITCAQCHVHTIALETEALALSAHEFGTVCHAAYGHLTSATNILRCCWRHICFDKATALCDILCKHLRNTLTCVCRSHLQHSFDYFNVMEQQSMSQFCVVLWCLVCARNMLLTNTGCCGWSMQGQINGQEGYFPKSFVVMLSKPGKVGVVQLLYNSVFVFV